MYVSGFFVNLFGDFWLDLGINSFSQRISNIYIGLKDLMLFLKIII